MASCSNCGEEFDIPGQTHGFSHCDQHDEHEPVESFGFTIVIPALPADHKRMMDALNAAEVIYEPGEWEAILERGNKSE